MNETRSVAEVLTGMILRCRVEARGHHADEASRADDLQRLNASNASAGRNADQAWCVEQSHLPIRRLIIEPTVQPTTRLAISQAAAIPWRAAATTGQIKEAFSAPPVSRSTASASDGGHSRLSRSWESRPLEMPTASASAVSANAFGLSRYAASVIMLRRLAILNRRCKCRV